MAEQIKNSGFWTYRFLITPEELEEWVKYLSEEIKINFKPDEEDDLSNTISVSNILIKNYRIFYNGLISQNADEQHSPFIRVWLTKDGFNNSIYLQKQFWYFDPPNETRVTRDFFLELISPKGFRVNDPDGKHYDFHDIHEKEPLAKKTFDELALPIKKITKSLMSDKYGTGKLFPEYQIRISKQAWTDLVNSEFMRGAGQRLSAKW
jgi:hypothetical protein